MRPLNSQERTEVQEKCLRLLQIFHNICEKENIWYSLAFGTVLGAVRHHGFIPWDTDVDVYIMLPDKNKFRAAFEKHKPDGIVLRNYDLDSRRISTHDILEYEEKQFVDGIHLDIYPLIGAPSNLKAQSKFVVKLVVIDKIFKSKYVDIRQCLPKNKIPVAAVKFIDFFIPDKCMKKTIRKLENSYPFNQADYLVTFATYPTPSSCIEKSVYKERVLLTFEGYPFYVPRDYDTYLTRIFGTDYMTPKKY